MVSLSQEEDFQWFLEHYVDLFCEYGESFLLIKSKKVLGCYCSYEDAVNDALKTEPPGTFIVQKCDGTEEAYTAFVYKDENE